MTLHLVQILPNSRALARFAHRAGLPEDDPGYLWHRALRDAFGAIAPQPFRHLDQALEQFHHFGEAARPVRLLGYAPSDAQPLRDALKLAAPDLDRVFPSDRIDAKALPLPFAVGRRLAFESRVCPIVRTKSSDGTRQRELDAFVHHALGMANEARPEREPVYRAWLTERLAAGGCRLIAARMTSFRLGPLVRRRHPEPARRLPATGRRAAARRPEVIFDGELEVTDPDAFARLLTRGVGRHRAFGFGMLLLRPA